MNNFFGKLGGALVLTAFIVGATHAATLNLVTNGSFESGLTGWTCTSANLCATDRVPHSGINAFMGYDNNGYGVLSQTINTSSGSIYDFSVFSKTYAGQAAGNEFGYSFTDFAHATFVPITDQYTQSFASFIATSNLTLLSLYFGTDPGTGVVFIDDVSVKAVPEPTTVALLGLGLLAVFASRRKSAKNKNA